MRMKKMSALILAAVTVCAALEGCSATTAGTVPAETGSAETGSSDEAVSSAAAEKSGAETESAEAGSSAAETEGTETESAATAAEGLTEDEIEKEDTGTSETQARGTGDVYDSSADTEHALSLSEGSAAYDGILVTKTGSGEGDEADFYGTNAAVYVENGADLSIANALIRTDGSHANAVFSYGEETNITISDSTIETEQNNSGGIMVTGGGCLTANDLTVTTQGGSSAPIRSDRGGGTETVNGGTYTAYGSGSPAIYSTADVTVTGATLYSDVSQAVVVEGKNSVTLIDTDATGKNTKKNSSNSDRCQAVMVYQSMSGDASEGCGKFTMQGGSLTSLYEGMFFVTNTVAEISLTDVQLNMASDDLLRIEAAGWGSEGSNGGQVTFTAKDQALSGVITVDESSSLNLLLSEGSHFEGCIEGDGEVYVELTDGAEWKLTADCSIASLTCEAESIELNGHQLTVGDTLYEEGTESTGEKTEIKVTEMKKEDTPPEKPGDGKGDGTTPPVKQGGGNGASGRSEGGDEPSAKADGDDGSTPPAKPDGDDGSTPPAKPDGGDGGTPPAKPDGNSGSTAPAKPDE